MIDSLSRSRGKVDSSGMNRTLNELVPLVGFVAEAEICSLLLISSPNLPSLRVLSRSLIAGTLISFFSS